MKALTGGAALALIAVLALAGCGGSGGGESVAHLESTSTPEVGGEAGGLESGTGEPGEEGGTEDKALAYTECMRSHGLSDFPEPVEGRIQMQAGPGSDLNPESPTFQKAEEACRALAPSMEPNSDQEAELQSSALEFAECMRANGVLNFPDPEVSEGRLKMMIPKGADPEAPAFEEAQEACRELMVGGPGGPPAP